MSKKDIDAYCEDHPWCQACGSQAHGAPHHIKTRGAGGGDEPDNLLRLCPTCHTLIHMKGDRWACWAWPWLANKIKAAKPKVAI
jgi:hypothetical protein